MQIADKRERQGRTKMPHQDAYIAF